MEKKKKRRVGESKETKMEQPHPKYKNIIFDLGNVLLTWSPRAFALDMFADRPNKEEIATELVRITAETKMWKDLDRGFLTYPEVQLELVRV